jgi:adenylate cyclase
MSNVLPTAYLEAIIDGLVRQFPLASDRVFRIGRSDKNDVVLVDDLASRNHAMLQQSGDGLFYITDLGSSNGTLVNGSRIAAPVILRPGDHVKIGNHDFKFHQEIVQEFAPLETPDELQSTNILFAQSLITVLVADIRDFTGMSQRMDAAQLSKVTGALFRESGRVLQAQGAWAQKYIGDAVMAVWVHKKREPELRELAAVFTGLSQMAEIAAGLQRQFELTAPLRFGAGINTGMASVGNVGSIASSDYTAQGEVVNKAFRLESATRELACDIVVGQGTYDFLNRSIQANPLLSPHTVRLKGYDEPTIAYSANLTSLPDLLDAMHLRPARSSKMNEVTEKGD